MITTMSNVYSYYYHKLLAKANNLILLLMSMSIAMSNVYSYSNATSITIAISRLKGVLVYE